MSARILDWDDMDTSSQPSGWSSLRAPAKVAEPSFAYASEEFLSQLEILSLLSNSTDSFVFAKAVGVEDRNVALARHNKVWGSEWTALNDRLSSSLTAVTQYLEPLVRKNSLASYVLSDTTKVAREN